MEFMTLHSVDKITAPDGTENTTLIWKRKCTKTGEVTFHNFDAPKEPPSEMDLCRELLLDAACVAHRQKMWTAHCEHMDKSHHARLIDLYHIGTTWNGREYSAGEYFKRLPYEYNYLGGKHGATVLKFANDGYRYVFGRSAA